MSNYSRLLFLGHDFLKSQQYINRRKISSRDPTQLQNTTRHAVLKNGCVTSSTAKYLRINTLRNTFEGAAHPSYIHIQQQADGRTGWAGIHMCEHWERASTETTDQTRPGTKPQATTTTLSATTTESQPAQAIIRNWLADKHAKWFRGVFCVPGVGTDTSRVTVCPLLDVCVTTDADWFRAQPMNYWQAGRQPPRSPSLPCFVLVRICYLK